MAEEAKEGEGEAKPEEAKKGGKKKLIIIIVVALLVVGGGVGGFLAMSGGGGEEGEEAAEEPTEESEEGAEGGELPGAVIPLETFIVNLQVKGSFLKTSIQLEIADPAPPPTFEADIPKIRDAIIRILSSKSSAEILTVEGKDKLRDELKNSVNEVLGSEDVVQVYFTDFIVQ